MGTMNCPPHQPTRGFDAQVAEMRAYEWFRADFLRRYPSGEVMTQYEYIARGSFAGAGGTPLRFAGKPEITALVDSMSDNFRRHVRFADFRKPDGIGMAEVGRAVRVELLEVTTEGNAASAIRQMRDKTAILSGVVAGASVGLSLEVRGTTWRPSEGQMTWPTTPQAGELARWICYAPTRRQSPPEGVTLYEVHGSGTGRPVPAFSPEAERALRRAYGESRERARRGEPAGEGLAGESPVAAREVANLAVTLGWALAVGAVAACVVAAATPVPGDELAVCSFALGVTRAAVRR